MPDKIHHTQCPVCGSNSIKEVFPVKDHTVSGELFPLEECSSCSLRFTQDVPDAEDIGHYYKSDEYISHSNTSRGLINRLYQIVRRRTIKRKCKLIKKATGLGKGRLLDLGSGIGTFVHAMAKEGWEVTGLEPDAAARERGKELYKIELGDDSTLYDLPLGSYDAITLWHVLEHIHDLQPCIQQLKSLLTEKGKLFIAVPNYTSKDASIYQEFWASYDVPRHLYHFSPASMKKLVESHELRIEKYKPMWYDSFYISMLSSKYKSGRTHLFSSFWNGLRSNLKALANTKKCSSIIYIISK